MNFTLHQLYVFGMVAYHSSMTKAARELHMSQPAVSIQIKRLQETIDIPLFEMVGGRLHLTEAGQRLYEVYNNVQLELDSFEAAISELKGGLTGTLTISAASTAKYFLPYLLGEFQRRYPLVKVTLKVTSRDEVLQHLSDNIYDLAILTQLPESGKMEAIPFLENPLVIGAPPNHPLAKEDDVSIKQIKEEPFIYREIGSGTRMVMENYLSQNGIESSPVMELGMNEAVKQAIMAGIGLSIISRLSLKSEYNLGKISILDMPDFPIMTHWHVLYNKEKKLTPVTKNFISFLQEDNIHLYLS